MASLKQQLEKKAIFCHTWTIKEGMVRDEYGVEVIKLSDVLGLLADYHEKLRDKSFKLSENIHDELKKNGVKGSGYAKLVNGVVWAWFTKELGLE